ncbi:MAG TPA: NRDE family protein [Thermoplasmata archaeon]|nr:NRDE family protein [Thermoplasmata archaeon]
MCSLILLWRAVDHYDIVLGMNRDESAMRAADPPAFVDGNPALVVPKDRTAGGAWIGASGRGLAMALSNRRGRISATARSRGLLLVEALKSPTIPAADIYLQRETQAHEYNFFNLLAATRQDLRFFRYDGQVSVTRGHEGLNVLTNEGGNVAGDPKGELVQNLLSKAPTRTVQDAVRTLQSALRTHASGGGVSLCNHAMGGGTVSSTILALSNVDPGENVLLYADGAPCQTPYRDYGEVIRRLPSPE